MSEFPVHALDNAVAHRVLLAPRGVAAHSTAARHGYRAAFAERAARKALQSKAPWEDFALCKGLVPF